MNYPRRTEHAAVRLTREEMSWLCARAREHELSVSSYLRQLLLAELEEPSKP
jgi:hypothetical protein